MNNTYYSKNLDEGEVLVEIVHRHPVTMAGPSVLAGIIIILDFFLLTLLFSQGLWGIIVFFVVFLFILIIIWRTWIIWSKNVFIITNRRIIDVDQHGFFSKTVSECDYVKIQDVSYTVKGLFATFFHFGRIQIQTAGNIANLELDLIKDPAHVQEVIMDQLKAINQPPENQKLTKNELTGALDKVNNKVDEETLKKLFKP